DGIIDAAATGHTGCDGLVHWFRSQNFRQVVRKIEPSAAQDRLSAENIRGGPVSKTVPSRKSISRKGLFAKCFG
ncbi:hypothetical protein, partial [Mesorhizobium sp.]|uniref:hypothetical protein n=1 Tax=Mesorhizobium sp. TaxID=1871066 RepID=UPI0025CC2F6B